MTGILSRYLSGAGTDPLAQQGGMEGYLSQFNVNPYWQQYLGNGQQPSGLLGTLAQQQYTQGGQNPYAQGQNAYQTPTPAAPKSNAGLTVLSGGQLQGKWAGNTGNLNPNAGQYTDIILSDGRMIPGALIGQQIADLGKRGDPAEYAAFFGSNFQGDGKGAASRQFAPGSAIPEALLKLIGG